MKRTIFIKYIFSLVAIFLVLFVVTNSIGKSMIRKAVIDKKLSQLWRLTETICSEYQDLYTKDTFDRVEMEKHLNAVSSLSNSRIWVTNSSGLVQVDSYGEILSGKMNVSLLDPRLLSYQTKAGLVFNSYFEGPTMVAVNSIINNLSPKGYVLVFMAENETDGIIMGITNTLNIFILFFGIALLLVLAAIYLFTIRPLHKVIKAAKEYGIGHFDQPIQIKTHDEFDELVSTINFMGSEINSLDEYQKKFVANISHDFRSPLTSIKGYAEAILDGTIPYESQNKYIDIILFETERLNKLTNNLLTLNTYERNGAMLNITTFDINKVIKKTITTFEGTCAKKKLTFNLVFSEKELYVDADIDKIQQVLYNLIDNAIKFSNSNNRIKISTSEKGEKAFIAVKDYGIGIPKDSIKKIWDRFYKTDSSRGKDKKGTGLGLSIAKEIITKHNENINVISTEGVGTEFIFSLPLAEEE